MTKEVILSGKWLATFIINEENKTVSTEVYFDWHTAEEVKEIANRLQEIIDYIETIG